METERSPGLSHLGDAANAYERLHSCSYHTSDGVTQNWRKQSGYLVDLRKAVPTGNDLPTFYCTVLYCTHARIQLGDVHGAEEIFQRIEKDSKGTAIGSYEEAVQMNK